MVLVFRFALAPLLLTEEEMQEDNSAAGMPVSGEGPEDIDLDVSVTHTKDPDPLVQYAAEI